MSSPRPTFSDSTWAIVDAEAVKHGFRSTDAYLEALLSEARQRGDTARVDAAQQPYDDDSVPSHVTSQALLDGIRNSELPSAERSRLVIEAEVQPFDPPLRAQLVHALGAFIEQKRDSQDPVDLVAVGAAVRKLVANLPGDDLSLAATLLDAGHRAVPPLEIELEVAKSVVRKFAAHPAHDPCVPASLADGLLDLAQTYLHDRLLAREKHGAVALNASLALLLIGGERGREVVELLKELHQTWFTELLARRAARLKEERLRRADAESAMRLDEVVRLFAPEQPSTRPSHAGAAT